MTLLWLPIALVRQSGLAPGLKAFGREHNAFQHFEAGYAFQGVHPETFEYPGQDLGACSVKSPCKATNSSLCPAHVFVDLLQDFNLPDVTRIPDFCHVAKESAVKAFAEYFCHSFNFGDQRLRIGWSAIGRLFTCNEV